MNNSSKIDIFYVEDNEVSRFALKNLLKQVPDFQVIGEASNGLSAVTQVSELDDCVVLVDIGLPDIDGIEVAQRIKANRPGCRVLMLTASDDQNDIFDALDAGAEGYILKANGVNNLEHARNLEAAIRSVKLGAVWLDPAIARLVLQSHAAQRSHEPRKQRTVEPIALSAEERNVLGQVAKSGCDNGVCFVDPDFVKKLRRFGNQTSCNQADNPVQMKQC